MTVLAFYSFDVEFLIVVKCFLLLSCNYNLKYECEISLSNMHLFLYMRTQHAKAHLLLGKFSFLYHMFLYQFTVAGADHGTTGVSGAIEIGKKRLLLKGKEKEISLVYVH